MVPGCLCPNTWLPSPSLDVTITPSSSPSGPLVGPLFEPLEYPELHHEITSHSSIPNATSPIAVTCPPHGHALYGPQVHLAAPAPGPVGGTAYSLPPQFYLPHLNQEAAGSSCSYSPSPVMFGEALL